MATGGLTRTAMALGAVVGALGALIVLAWVMHWDLVLRLHPRLPVMQFNTALLFIASGAGLVAGARDARREQAVLGVLILLLAVPTFLQFPLDRSLGVDTLLWVPYTGSEGFALGRMAPSTAAALLLTGLAFAAGPSDRLRSAVAGGAAAAILTLSGFAFVEYVFGSGASSGWSRYARMAVHTAGAVGLIGGGLWCLAWRDGTRTSRQPAWLPWTGASAALVLTALLATALTTVFPVDAWPLVLATTIGLGLAVAVLVFTALAMLRVARERADQIEASAQALALSEVRHRAVFEQSSAGIIELTVGGELLRVNPGFCAMLGRTPAELTGLHLSDITHPDDLAQDTRHFAEATHGTLPPEGWVKRYLRADGGVVWAHVSGSLVHAPDGLPLYLVGVIHDVTSQVQTEERLRESETRFRSVAEMAAAGIVMADAGSTIVFANRAATAMFGAEDGGLVGHSLTSLMPEAYRREHAAGVARFMATGEARVLGRSLTLEGLRRDGHVFPLDLSISTWEVRGQRYFTGIVRDVTERAQAERALRESEQRLRLALENASHGLWDLDVRTGALVLDEHWWRIMGYPPGERPATVDAWQATVDPDDLPRLRAALEQSLASDTVPYDVDYRARRPDGELVWINTRGRVQERAADGTPLRMMGTIHDVSARKQAEAQIRGSLEEKDVLLREIHHRVKNNLAIISGLFYLESTTTDHPEALRVLAESRARIQSMALVHEFLYRSDRLSAVDFAEYVTQLARQLLGSMQVGDRAAALVLDTADVSLPIDTAIPLGLILNEILTNSLKHAFPAGRMPAPPAIRLMLRREDDGTCTLCVADNGVGMGDVDPRQGRTLGLRLMRSLAQQVGGALHFTALSPGTEVRVTFSPGGRAPAVSA